MARESWIDYFEQEVKTALRDKVTNFEDVWGLMFLDTEKQELLSVAGQIAARSIESRDCEIARLGDVIDDRDKEIYCFEEHVNEVRRNAEEREKRLVNDLEARDRRIREMEEERVILMRKNQTLERQFEREVTTMISDLTQTTIDQHKQIMALWAKLHPDEL
jgi:hypothetical protein